MTMIEERYVSLEVAKLLKEKGFNNDYPKGDCTQIACTHQMAMEWLREKDVYISIESFINISSEGYNLEGYKPWITTFKTNWFNPLSKIGTATYSKTYEEAVEAALKYSLENLV